MENSKRLENEIQELVAKYKNGEQEVLDKIIKNLGGFIYKTTAGIYLKNYETEDFTQEAKLYVLKALQRYRLDSGKRFAPYAMGAIRNNFNYLIRTNSRYGFEGSLDTTIGEDIQLIDMISSEENVEEKVIKKEEYRRLKKCINKLNPDEKEMLRYLFAERNKLVDYAKLKNMSYWVCNHKKTDLLKKMRKLMEFEG